MENNDARYEILFAMDHDEETGEWLERENNALAGFDLRDEDLDTIERGDVYVSRYTVTIDERAAARFEQILDSHADVISYREFVVWPDGEGRTDYNPTAIRAAARDAGIDSGTLCDFAFDAVTDALTARRLMDAYRDSIRDRAEVRP